MKSTPAEPFWQARPRKSGRDRHIEAREGEWFDYTRDLWRERQAAAERGEFREGTPAEMMAGIRARVER